MNDRARTIRRLKALEKDFPDDLILFAAAGSLCLVDRDTHKVIRWFHAIHCDGGDPGTRVKEDGEYLIIDEGRA